MRKHECDFAKVELLFSKNWLSVEVCEKCGVLRNLQPRAKHTHNFKTVSLKHSKKWSTVEICKECGRSRNLRTRTSIPQYPSKLKHSSSIVHKTLKSMKGKTITHRKRKTYSKEKLEVKK